MKQVKVPASVVRDQLAKGVALRDLKVPGVTAPAQSASGKPKKTKVAGSLEGLPAAKGREMTKPELEMQAMLEVEKRDPAGDVDDYEYEAITLKLGDDCRYTPDFVVKLRGSPSLRVIEVKGERIWEDSLVKLRMAASKYPRWEFILAQKRSKKAGGGWEFRRVEPG